ncbi:hypothetical protein TH63_11895 [Rufibacter radiotolerans]|uniref:Uncharacterized protein n=1 Tax=Rufibacter radiotolerans TaxID=1379910 RepID=A0A0H4VQG0_9BACT|nr:hypothetical protein TH63_11895 [Rufibacter radiotolerans]
MPLGNFCFKPIFRKTIPKRNKRYSLSLRERARVRGSGGCLARAYLIKSTPILCFSGVLLPKRPAAEFYSAGNHEMMLQK